MTKEQKPGFLKRLLGKDKIVNNMDNANKEEENTWAHFFYKGETIFFREEKAHKALDLFEHSLDIARKTGDRKAEGYSLEMLGEVLPIIGKEDNDINYLHRAIKYSEAALAISHEVDDKTLEGKVLRTLAGVLMARNDINSSDLVLANEYLEKSTTIFRENGNLEETANSLTALAFLLQKLGQGEHARQIALEASRVRTNFSQRNK
jgi:tetratricopeptide (TPR) repeat protein